MTEEQFVRQARAILGAALQCLGADAPGQYLSLIQVVREDLTALVEEFEGVLDA